MLEWQGVLIQTPAVKTMIDIQIEGENDLYYYSTTHIVYITFNECAGYPGYGYMAPYYSESGKLCTYDINTKQIVEVGE